MAKKYRIIFACVGNSCRSQMAEGFARKIYPETIEIISAGTRPSNEVNPDAMAVMLEVGIDISNQEPKMLTTAMLKGATHFISMGCGVMDSCPFPLVKQDIKLEDWVLEDPNGRELDFFRFTRDEIENRVKELLNKLR
ncbi:MAG: arsenate-mycothiol transferase ArsC [Promethearchaeota archaeon]